MSVDKLKQYIQDVIIEDGYQLCLINFNENHLDRLINLCEEAKKDLYNNQHELLKWLFQELTYIKDSSVMDWEDKYDICWKIKNKMFRVCHFEWYDPDATYEEDFMAFYNAAKEYVEGL